jgi:hypothetical protein
MISQKNLDMLLYVTSNLPAGDKGTDSIKISQFFKVAKPIKDWENYKFEKHENLPIKSLVATQSSTKRHNTTELVRMLYNGFLDAPIKVVRKDGVNYVVDGHHRLLSHSLMGDTAIPADIEEL